MHQCVGFWDLVFSGEKAIEFPRGGYDTPMSWTHIVLKYAVWCCVTIRNYEVQIGQTNSMVVYYIKYGTSPVSLQLYFNVIYYEILESQQVWVKCWGLSLKKMYIGNVLTWGDSWV